MQTDKLLYASGDETVCDMMGSVAIWNRILAISSTTELIRC